MSNVILDPSIIIEPGTIMKAGSEKILKEVFTKLTGFDFLLKQSENGVTVQVYYRHKHEDPWRANIIDYRYGFYLTNRFHKKDICRDIIKHFEGSLRGAEREYKERRKELNIIKDILEVY